MNGKNLVILGAGIEACEGIKTAKALGLSLIVVDGDEYAPGFTMADYKIVVSTYDGDTIVKEVLRLQKRGIKIHGAIAMCADVPVSVAKITSALHLPGLSMQSAHWVADKLLMKEQLKKKCIPIPKFFPVESEIVFETLIKNLDYPFVIKPVDSRGARGVQLVENDTQLGEAFLRAKEESPTGRVMAEEYLSGPQVSTETLIENGRCFTIGFSDRNYEWLEKTKPFFIENGGELPSKLPKEAQRGITHTVEDAALALGITHGVAKGDMVLSPEGPKVIEIAGRLSGGYFSTTQIPIVTGVNFVHQAIKLALNEKLDIDAIQPKQHCALAVRYLELATGDIKAIDGADNARNAPGMEMLELFIKPGDSIDSLTNHTQRAGFVICTASTTEAAITRAQDALSMIKIIYADDV